MSQRSTLDRASAAAPLDTYVGVADTAEEIIGAFEGPNNLREFVDSGLVEQRGALILGLQRTTTLPPQVIAGLRTTVQSVIRGALGNEFAFARPIFFPGSTSRVSLADLGISEGARRRWTFGHSDTRVLSRVQTELPGVNTVKGRADASKPILDTQKNHMGFDMALTLNDAINYASDAELALAVEEVAELIDPDMPWVHMMCRVPILEEAQKLLRSPMIKPEIRAAAALKEVVGMQQPGQVPLNFNRTGLNRLTAAALARPDLWEVEFSGFVRSTHLDETEDGGMFVPGIYLPRGKGMPTITYMPCLIAHARSGSKRAKAIAAKPESTDPLPDRSRAEARTLELQATLAPKHTTGDDPAARELAERAAERDRQRLNLERRDKTFQLDLNPEIVAARAAERARQNEIDRQLIAQMDAEEAALQAAAAERALRDAVDVLSNPAASVLTQRPTPDGEVVEHPSLVSFVGKLWGDDEDDD